jgi:hypothetical protein
MNDINVNQPGGAPDKGPSRPALEPKEVSAAAVMDPGAGVPKYRDAHLDILTETCNLCDTPRSAAKPDCLLQNLCDRHALRACRRCGLRVLPALFVQAGLADPMRHGLKASLYFETYCFKENYAAAVDWYGGWYTWRYVPGHYATSERYKGPGWPGPRAGERVEADLGRPGAGPTYRPKCRACGDEIVGGTSDPRAYLVLNWETVRTWESLQFKRRRKRAGEASPRSDFLSMIQSAPRLVIANREEMRKSILTETCFFCRIPQTACRPERANLPVCRDCALCVLPGLMALAVLADPEGLFAKEEALKVRAVISQNLLLASNRYLDYYERAYRTEFDPKAKRDDEFPSKYWAERFVIPEDEIDDEEDDEEDDVFDYLDDDLDDDLDDEEDDGNDDLDPAEDK